MDKRSYHYPEDFLMDDSFRQYCMGNPDAQHHWSQWLALYPDKKRLFDDAVRLYGLLHGSSAIADLPEASLRFQQALLEKDKAKRIWYHYYRRWLYAAAGILFVSALSWVLYYRGGISGDLNTSTYVKLREGETVKNNSASRIQLILPDGSSCILNAYASIRLDKKFGQQHRTIFLMNGIAFFDIVPQKMQPFFVLAGNTRTQVLGTSFMVRADSLRQISEVMLVSGRVRVLNNGVKADKGIELKPGEKWHVDIKAQKASKEHFSLTQASQWQRGQLAFEEATVEDTFKQLEQWFGVHIYLSGTIPSSTAFSAQFNYPELASILKILSYTYRFTYRIDKDKVYIDFNKDN